MAEELVAAAQDGDARAVRRLLALGAHADATNAFGWTALRWAADGGHLSVSRLLLARGAAVDAAGSDGRTALMQGARGGHLGVVRLLCAAGADIERWDEDGWTALTWAARGGHLDVVEELVARGASVDSADRDGWTAFMQAVRGGYADIARSLARHGADVNVADRFGWTALIQAARSGYVDVVRYLVDSGADVHAVKKDGRTALMQAAAGGHLDVAEFLVTCGAEVNTADKDGWTALMWAARGDNLRVVAYLMDCGADMNATSKTGESPLIGAAERGHVEVVRYLVRHYAKVDAQKNDGRTALALAARGGHLSAVQVLVDSGADLNASAVESGWTALMQAASSGHLSVVQFLVDRGADVNAVNKNGLTALSVAAKHGQLEVQNWLSRFTSTSQPSRIDFESKVTSSNLPEFTISPFEVDAKQFNDSANLGGEYVATWLDADVALKLFVPDAANSTFTEEVRLWHQLRHPNVIKLYGACDVGHNFFVCELASNGSLTDYLANCEATALTPWKYLHHAALGLAYLHERGIIHGNLRGSNILVGNDGLAKLTNFGLSGSKEDIELSASRGFVGSMRWQAPELLEGGKPSRTSDIYALGLCVVEALTRKMPWNEYDEGGAKWRKKRWQPESYDGWCEPAELSIDLRWLLKQLCCQDPKLRDTASACVRIFERFAEEELNLRDSGEPEPEPVTGISGYHGGDLMKMWKNISDLSCDFDGLHQLIVRDLDEVMGLLQNASQPLKLVEEIDTILSDAVSVIQNIDQVNLVVHLLLVRGVSDSVLAFRRRLTKVKQNFHADGDIQSSDDGVASHNQQVFVSEVSKTWSLLEERGTSEEFEAFLVFLRCEIIQHREKYLQTQIDILQSIHDKLKHQMSLDSAIAVATPIWFVPWYELTVDKWGEIGAGGYGRVFRAKWLDSDVVVKRLGSYFDNANQSVSTTASSTFQSWMLSNATRQRTGTTSGLATRDEARKIFEREVDIWFRLSHPHVVRLFGACNVGSPFFVCEYASNGSLDKYLSQHPDEIWKKLYEAALGLLYLHERGIVHCDLKCNNIVVGIDNNAKVTDFGLSSAASTEDDGSETSGHITGAWNWLAPELMMGDTTTPSYESDVFSFAMCIIEALRVVEAAHIEPSKRELLPPCVPWQLLGMKSARVRMKRGELPTRPGGCTDAQWSLVKRMARFEPHERIHMSTVVDELSLFARLNGLGLASELLVIKSQINIATLASSMIAYVTKGQSDTGGVGSRSVLYQLHELLWKRIQDVYIRAEKYDIQHRLELLAADSHAATLRLQTCAETLVKFTEAALQAYGLHRRLDKLMIAKRVPAYTEETNSNLHGWKVKCYTIVGVDSDLAAQQLSRESIAT